MEADDVRPRRAAASASSSAPTSSTGRAVRAGDAIVGLASSGLHANGFSLVRALLAQWDLDLAEPYQARLRRSLGDAEADGGRRGRSPNEAMATLGEVLLTPTRDLRPGRARARAPRSARPATTSAASPTSPAAACPATCRGRCRTASPRGSTRRAGRCRRSCACSARSAGSTTRSCARRSTAGSGWSWSCRRRRSRRRSTALAGEHGIAATVVGEVVDAAELGGARYVEGPLGDGRVSDRADRGRRLGCGLEPAGAGGGGRARRARRRRSSSSFADRACPALDWAAEQGIETALVPGGDDATLAETLAGGRARRRRARRLHADRRAGGPRGVRRPDPQHAPVAPAGVPGRPRRRATRWPHGVAVTGVHRPPRRRDARRRPDRRPGGGRRPARRRRGDASTSGSSAVEHRLLPRAVALLLAGARRGRAGRPARRDRHRPRPTRAVPVPRRALLSVSDKTGLVDVRPRASSRAGSSSSRPAARRAPLREAGLPVTDVAAVTGLPGDARRAGQDAPPADPRRDPRRPPPRRPSRASSSPPAIAPFELVVVNLYPFAAAAERPGHHARRARRGDRHRRAVDGPGGRQEPRQRRDRHVAGALRRGPRGARRRRRRSPTGCGAALAVEAFRHTAAYDARIAAELPPRMAAAGVALPDEPGLPGAEDPYPADPHDRLEKVETLRYGENPHQPAARYRRPGRTAADGPFATGAPPLQGKAAVVQQRPRRRRPRRRSAGPCAARPASSSSTRTRAAPPSARRSLEAWEAALAGDPVSAFGGVVALTRPVDAAIADGARRRSSSRSSSRPASTPAARESSPRSRTCASSSTPRSASRRAAPPPDPTRLDPHAPAAPSSSRAPDTARRRPGDLAGRHDAARPTDARAPRPRPRLAARPRRHVERDRPRPRRPADRARARARRRRVDAARQAVDEGARVSPARPRLRGRGLRLGRVLPVPDAVEVCLEAGVTRVRPARRLDARRRGDRRRRTRAGATMLLTGIRHFRH